MVLQKKSQILHLKLYNNSDFNNNNNLIFLKLYIKLYIHLKLYLQLNKTIPWKYMYAKFMLEGKIHIT